jgi:hypothetical protein
MNYFFRSNALSLPFNLNNPLCKYLNYTDVIRQSQLKSFTVIRDSMCIITCFGQRDHLQVIHSVYETLWDDSIIIRHYHKKQDIIFNKIVIMYKIWAGIAHGIATRYGGGRSAERIPVGAKFSATVQTSPGSHPASYTMDTGPFSGLKPPERGVDHPPPPT